MHPAPTLQPAGSVVAFCWGTAGRARALAALPGTTPALVVIVDPLAGSRVHDEPADAAGAEAIRIEGVVGQRDGRITLHRYSLPGLASLAPATAALRLLYPALTGRPPIMVPQIDAATILARLVVLPRPLTVVIDTPGDEAALLDRMQACAVLDRIDRLVLRCSREVCFAGGESAESLIARLAAAGFAPGACDASDPDWPVHTLHADHDARRIAALEQRLAEAEARLGAQARTHARHLRTHARTRAALDREQAAHAETRRQLAAALARLHQTGDAC